MREDEVMKESRDGAGEGCGVSIQWMQEETVGKRIESVKGEQSRREGGEDAKYNHVEGTMYHDIDTQK